MKRLFFSIFTAMIILSFSPAVADEKEEKKSEEVAEEKKIEKPAGYYAPEFCDFEITFPEKPFITKRCPQNISKCYQLVSYTYVYDLKTTVEVSANCVPSTPASYKKYTEPVMKSALNGMAQRSDLNNSNISTVEKDNVRQGSVIGTGNYGRQSRIYNAQLWIGQNSIMSIEARLTGTSHPEADAAFGEILSSLKVKESNKPED